MSQTLKMASTRTKIRDVVNNLESSSKTASLNALIHVRKKIITQSEHLKIFIEIGGLENIFHSVFSRIPKNPSENSDAENDEKNRLNPSSTLEHGSCENSERAEIYEKLCKTEFKKSLDVALSIIGNICMNPDIRRKVQELGGTEIIGDILKHVSETSLQNRACRVLTNMSLNADICSEIHKDEDIIARIVDLLKQAKDEDFQQTLLRSLRILGDTPTHKELVLKADGVAVSGKLLSSDHKKVAECCWKTLLHYNTRKFSSEFCKQIVSSGCLPTVIDQAQSCDEIKQRQALSIIYSIVTHSDGRPSLGNASVIPLFINMVRRSVNSQSKTCIDAVQGLCLMCWESVNRVRIREDGGLQLLLELLNDEDFVGVHERIVGSFVCFLYDSASMQFLLKEGLVGLLMKQLRKIVDAACKNKAEFSGDNLDSSKEFGMFSDNLEEGEDEMDSQEDDGSESQQCCELESEGNEKSNDTESVHEITNEIASADDISKPPTELELNENFSTQNEDNTTLLPECSKISSVKPSNLDPSEENIAPSSMKKSETRYSIHSPTYVETAADWSFEDYSSGVKCKQSFSPNPQSPSSLGAGVSPQSCVSYYSPVYSPGESSSFIFQSPSASPLSTSGSCQGYSPFNTSFSPINFSKTGEEYSSAEEDGDGDTGADHPSMDEPSAGEALIGACIEQLEVDKSKFCRDAADKVREDKFDILDAKTLELPSGSRPDSSEDSCVMGQPLMEQAETGKKSPCLLFNQELSSEPEPTTSDQSSSNIINDEIKEDDEASDVLSDNPQSATPRRRTRTRRLTSIGSHGDACVKYHTVSDTDSMESNILTLLSLISHLEDPSPYLPSQDVFNTLLDYATGCRHQAEGSRWYRILSRICSNPHCFEFLLTSLAAHIVYSKLYLACGNEESKCNDSEVHSSETKDGNKSSAVNVSRNNKDSDSHSEKMELSTTSPTSSHKSHGHKHNFSLKGEALLFKLTMQAASSYGRGVVINKLLKGSDKEKLAVAISLCFICGRDSEARNKLMISYKVLDILLEGLQESNDLFTEIVQALHYLSHRVAPVGRISDIKQRRPALPWNYSMPNLIAYSKQKSSAGPLKRKVFNVGDTAESQVTKKTKINERRRNSCDSEKSELVGVDSSGVSVIEVGVMGLVDQKGGDNSAITSVSTGDGNTKQCSNLESLSNNDVISSTSSLTGKETQPDSTLTDHDVTFILDSGSHVSAKRSSLVRRSSLFSAMLEGHYSESQQSSINLSNVPGKAFKYIIHWLHGCKLSECCHDDYQGLFKSVASLGVCMEILALCDRFLLRDLQDQVAKNIGEYLLDGDSFLHVLETALHSNCHKLVEMCALFVITNEMSQESRVCCFRDIAQSQEKDTFMPFVRRSLMTLLGIK